MTENIFFRDREQRKRQVSILHSDAHLLVVDKPPGLPVIPDRWQQSPHNLRDLLLKHLAGGDTQPDPGLWIVHRIDANTSGVLLLARSAEMHRTLNLMFAENHIHKTYHAIVNSTPVPTEGRIEQALAPHRSHKPRMIASRDGKSSVTLYRVLESFRQFAYLAVEPQTGRTHQIRVHLAEIACPLAVDPLYGNRDSISISALKKRYHAGARGERPLMDRLSLHAFRIAFTDPLSGKPMAFTAELPKDFRGLLNALRKWNGK